MTFEAHFGGFHQYFTFRGKSFNPQICLQGMPAENANCATLPVDLSTRSSLKWPEASAKAKNLVEKGFLLLWDLQTDLFQQGAHFDDGILRAFELGMDHFNRTLGESFLDHTLGAILYRGDLSSLHSGESLSLLKQCAAALREEFKPFVLLSCEPSLSAAEFFRKTSKRYTEFFQLAINTPFLERFPHALPALKWVDSTLLQVAPSSPLPTAVLLPEHGGGEGDFEKLIAHMPISFRVIDEPFLIQEWDGVDNLCVVSKGLSEQGKRMLRGFCAAGGCVVTWGDSLGLPHEIPFEAWV